MATQLPSQFEQSHPIPNTSQNLSYRFPPSYLRPARLGQGEEPRKTAPTAFIFSPSEDQRVSAEAVVLKGYAFTDICREIEQVELSTDGGKTWVRADLSPNPQPGEWRLWRKQIALAPGTHQLVVRAADYPTNQTLPDANKTTWHRVNFEVIA